MRYIIAERLCFADAYIQELQVGTQSTDMASDDSTDHALNNF